MKTKPRSEPQFRITMPSRYWQAIESAWDDYQMIRAYGCRDERFTKWLPKLVEFTKPRARLSDELTVTGGEAGFTILAQFCAAVSNCGTSRECRTAGHSIAVQLSTQRFRMRDDLEANEER